MLKERYELETALDSLIFSYNANKKIASSIKKELLDSHGVTGGDFQKVWSRNKKLELVDEHILFLFTKYLQEFTGDIKLEDFYTETEIHDGNSYKRDGKIKVLSFPLTFEKVLQGKDDQFVMFLSIQKIKELQDSAIITYNFDTQRSPKHKINREGNLIKVANVNKQAVKEISNFFLEGRFITNIITLNLLQDGTDEFVYNERTQELTILSGQVNVIDGFHRIMGMIMALGKNPNLDYIMEVRLTNWDIQRCRNFIHQENIRNKISTKYLQSVINTEKWGNKVVTKLNNGNSDLKGKITTDTHLIRINRAYTMFDMMSDTIDYLWEFKTNMDVNNLSKYLTEFFDFIIGYKVDDFINDLEESRKKSIITYPATFIGYLAVASNIQNKDNWQDKLRDFLDNTNFSRANKDWIELGIENRTNNLPSTSVNKSALKNIVSYFEKS